MDNNLDIKVESYNPLVERRGRARGQGLLRPVPELRSSTRTRARARRRNAFSGGDKVTTDGSTWNFGLGQAVPTGG